MQSTACKPEEPLLLASCSALPPPAGCQDAGPARRPNNAISVHPPYTPCCHSARRARPCPPAAPCDGHGMQLVACRCSCSPTEPCSSTVIPDAGQGSSVICYSLETPATHCNVPKPLVLDTQAALRPWGAGAGAGKQPATATRGLLTAACPQITLRATTSFKPGAAGVQSGAQAQDTRAAMTGVRLRISPDVHVLSMCITRTKPSSHGQQVHKPCWQQARLPANRLRRARPLLHAGHYCSLATDTVQCGVTSHMHAALQAVLHALT